MSHVTAVLSGTGTGKDGGKRYRSQADFPKRNPIIGIYFIRCGQFVKIGQSMDIASRAKDLQACNPFPLEVVGYEPYGSMRLFDRENEIHALLAEHHHQGEWFHLSEPVKAYIRMEAQRWPTSS